MPEAYVVVMGSGEDAVVAGLFKAEYEAHDFCDKYAPEGIVKPLEVPEDWEGALEDDGA